MVVLWVYQISSWGVQYGEKLYWNWFILRLSQGVDMEELHFLGVILLILFLMHIISFTFLQAHSLGFKWNVTKSKTETKWKESILVNYKMLIL